MVRSFRIPGILALLACAACESTSAPEPDRTIEVVSGALQTGGAAATLTDPVTVRVLDASGHPVSNAQVTWQVIEGGGSASDATTVTDSDGRASVRWTLGMDLGSQLLLATSGNSSITIRANSVFQIAAVSAGYRHTCALSSTGNAYCWGSNDNGQLGDGSMTSSSTPVRVNTTTRFTAIIAAWSHTCALSLAGAAYCWGDNSVGQLGTGTTGRAFTPTPVALSDAFAQIDAGFAHTCGVTTAGAAICWGANGNGQLGATPVNGFARILNLTFTSISTDEFHTCGIVASIAHCWGWNSAGELGANAEYGAIYPLPTPVRGVARYTQVSAGVRHTCGLATTGDVYCWGRNAWGETGLDPFVGSNAPIQVNGATGFSLVDTGNTHTCGIASGRAYCWGNPLGDGTTGSSKTPVAVAGGLTFSTLSTGFGHTCGVANGEVWCWGDNTNGQLGQSGLTSATAPVKVTIKP